MTRTWRASHSAVRLETSAAYHRRNSAGPASQGAAAAAAAAAAICQRSTPSMAGFDPVGGGDGVSSASPGCGEAERRPGSAEPPGWHPS